MQSRRAARRFAAGEEGQSTLEWVIVALALAAVIAGLAALVRLGGRGTLGRLATAAASHAIQRGDLSGALLDVLMF